MAAKSKIILEKPKKSQMFVWEPIESFNLRPKFFTGTFLSLKSPKEKSNGLRISCNIVFTNFDSALLLYGSLKKPPVLHLKIFKRVYHFIIFVYFIILSLKTYPESMRAYKRF
jgi:hypothetical protein